MEKVALDLIRSYKVWKYHSIKNKTAISALKDIESVKGKTDKKLIKLADEYATEVLGWKGYAPWLYVYTAINQQFKEGWISDNYYGRVVVPIFKGYYGTISEYNALTSLIFRSPLFPNCVCYTNGLWLSPDNQILTDKEVEEIAKSQNTRLVYKIDNSLQGRGIHFIEKDNFSIAKLKSLGNGVLQRYINQHPFFQEIIPNSVATLRITSVVDDQGVISVRGCYLRVGRSSDTHVKSASHIRIPVNISTGELDKYGYTINWHQTETHPDTQFVFESKKIPDFNKFIETTLNLHKIVPFTRSIGWDMIMDDKNNVQVMEWNGPHNDIKFSEATQGPCYTDLGWENFWKKGN